ncbi:MAG TPA: UDP-N-acetylglucosamine 2-epimerase, partial [Thermoplasmata archaeon]|nr:UDP-N-acetylglucosamine 2-epimerase [Thermoplasmata archaeon]
MGRLKVMTILGTRPEIIRLSTTIPLLDRHCDHYLVHTGQNYDENLSDVFFKELGIRAPDEYLSVKAGTWSGLIAQIIEKAAAAMKKVKPDRVLILGDTNSGMAAFAAARLNIPVFHIEGGNRCYDDRVPEEVNRRVIDACSTVLMAYTNRSKENLLDEGYPREWIHVIGNPMFEVLKAYEKQIEASDALRSFKLKPRKYIAVTLHRSENVDVKRRLKEILETLEEAGKKY